jgi:hypothetical protein
MRCIVRKQGRTPRANSVRHPIRTGCDRFAEIARHAAIAVYGERWDLCTEAYVWARLPRSWVAMQVGSRNAGSRRFSVAPRDHKLLT